MPYRHASTTNWSEAQCPQTPLQRRSFLEMCTNWIVSEPDPDRVSEPFEENMRTLPSKIILRDATHHQTCFTTSEARYLQHRKCIVCGSTRNVDVILANPFAIRCYVGVCVSCSS